MLEIKLNEYGNLELSIPGEPDRQEVAGELEDENHGELRLWHELIEPFIGNGQYYHVEPVDIGALTDDPYILTDDLEYEDNGTVNVKGEVWHYPDYALKSVVEELAAGNTVILRKANNGGE